MPKNQLSRAYHSWLSSFLTAVFAVSLFAIPAKALAESKLNDAEIQELANYFNQFVQTTKRPFYVYNWFGASADSSLAGPISSDANEGFEDVRQMIRKHWEAGRFTGEQAVMGAGLYTAVDPSISREYGGNDHWVLTQIRIPKGSRVLNLPQQGYDGLEEIPERIFNLLHKSDCGFLILPEMMLRTMMDMMLGDHVGIEPPANKCFALARKIFDEKLKLDLVGYSWKRGAISSDICPNLQVKKGAVDSVSRSAFRGQTGHSSPEVVAFVLLRAERLAKDDVRIYNRFSTDDVEARTYIQGLAVQSASAAVIAPLWSDLNIDWGKVIRWSRQNIFGCDSAVDFGL